MSYRFPQQIDILAGASTPRLEVSPSSYHRLRVFGGLLPRNGEMVLGYLELGYWSITIISDRDSRWVPSVVWKPFQRRSPIPREVTEWWMKYLRAGIALICGQEAGLIVRRSGEA